MGRCRSPDRTSGGITPNQQVCRIWRRSEQRDGTQKECSLTSCAKGGGTQAMKALARIGVMALAICASPHPGELYAAADSLPQGPAVGDQDLSPFYRWAGALPEKPGLMLREEGIQDQP